MLENLRLAVDKIKTAILKSKLSIHICAYLMAMLTHHNKLLNVLQDID